MLKFKVHPCLTLFKVICPIFLNDFQLHGFKKSSHRIFRLNNIAKVLSFLEERNVSSSTWRMGTPPGSGLTQHIHACTFLQVKLVSIDAADVADGNASIILGLIWNIILFFQVTFVGFPLSQLGAKHKKGKLLWCYSQAQGKGEVQSGLSPSQDMTSCRSPCGDRFTAEPFHRTRRRTAWREQNGIRSKWSQSRHGTP